ncbi:TBC1 domain family member 24 [Hypsibius exemplaris]|uniref:TBC1 domain family member 24 n=1 Tax=Hypsibius exemplaris TaxID=2072580 RepID=A0A1W0WX21_HYPEX|nr:TBC1 domain family member 24 [Hypsibius exemplaris]
MPESPVGFSNGPTPSASVTSVQREFQQKFLQSDAAGGDHDRQQLERLLKQASPDPAKKFIRAGDWAPNHSLRGQLWVKLCRRLTSDGDWAQSIQHYKDTLPDVYKRNEGRPGRSIPMPVFTDSTMTQTYYLNEDGRLKCQKILTMIEANNPQITYAPALYPLTALFLHFVQDEAEVFACIDALIRPKKTGKFFMGDTVTSWKSASKVMAELVRRRMKAIYNFILHSIEGTERRDELFDNWLKWIFVDLPFETVIRVVDCYLYEGMKVLFRTGLALMKLFFKSAGRPYSMPNLAQNLSLFCREIQKHCSAADLLKVGFSFPRLAQDDLLTMIRQFEVTIQATPAARISPSDEGAKTYPGEYRRSISVPASVIPTDVINMSRILREDQFYALWQWLPLRHRIAQPTLLYTSEEHGTSLVTFFQQTGPNEPTILLVKTRNDDVFGAFCSHSWENRFGGGKSLSYFGTGESFLFTLAPYQALYSWIGLGQTSPPTSSSSLFMAADQTSLLIGGGGGNGLRFDSTLAHGRTEPCTTFANPCLCANGKGDFECSIVEAFGFMT